MSMNMTTFEAAIQKFADRVAKTRTITDLETVGIQLGSFLEKRPETKDIIETARNYFGELKANKKFLLLEKELWESLGKLLAQYPAQITISKEYKISARFRKPDTPLNDSIGVYEPELVIAFFKNPKHPYLFVSTDDEGENDVSARVKNTVLPQLNTAQDLVTRLESDLEDAYESNEIPHSSLTSVKRDIERWQTTASEYRKNLEKIPKEQNLQLWTDFILMFRTDRNQYRGSDRIWQMRYHKPDKQKTLLTDILDQALIVIAASTVVERKQDSTETSSRPVENAGKELTYGDFEALYSDYDLNQIVSIKRTGREIYKKTKGIWNGDWQILVRLIESKGKFVSNEQLKELLRGTPADDETGSNKELYNAIYRLRNKLKIKIEGARGSGYRLMND